MEFIGVLLLIYMVLKWENILALPAFILGIILLIKIHKIRKQKENERQEKYMQRVIEDECEVREKVQKGEIVYKDAFLNDDNYIENVTYKITVEEFKELLENLKKFADDYESSKYYVVFDAFGHKTFSYERYFMRAVDLNLRCPIYSYEQNVVSKTKKEIDWIKDITAKEFKNLTDFDINHALSKWKRNGIITGSHFVTDKECNKIYDAVLSQNKPIRRSINHLNEILKLNSTLEDYEDFFGNKINFK